FTEVGQIARKYNRVLEKVHEEMSQRDLALNDFKSSEKRKSAILNSSMDSIVTINLDGQIIEFNPASERTFGCLRSKVSGKNFVDLFVLPKDKLAVQRSLEGKFLTSDGLLINRRNTILLKRSTGDEFPSEITITGTTFGSSISNEFTLHIRDVTRQRRLQEKLKQLAYSDPLTGLYNRTYFMESLTKALKNINQTKHCIALFFLDLDRFKKINDTLGHQAGDELLMEVANRLMNVTRSEDTICRWGGDEFVIMMNSRHDESSVLTSSTKILQVMRQPVVLSGRELTIPTSIGVTLTHSDSVSPTTLIQQADIAMYYAKKAGRDNYKLFEPYMAEQESELFDSEQTLSQAIAEKKAFSMLYQPRVNAEKDIAGFEALVRFTNPAGHFVPPAQFIPLAEESNLIVPLEELIFELVFAQIAQWKNAFVRVPRVSINLSGKHLLSDGLLPFLKRLMKQYSIQGDWFEIEVTEGVFLADIETCIDVLQALQDLNIAISIDDFGTGYSSLNYLKTLPVDILKIDRSFVNECAVKEEDAKICSTIITLAGSLGLSTVAEGVETAEQFAFLHSHGCSEFQGYHFYRPLSADAVKQHLIDMNETAFS
ncbi:putative bifunctional diguanylate cyclase/phosphodiesterase, partial [Alteromonas sp. AMM-1]|uniref:putative bifunctional diguanylate cyclase/phosphodiesterase n=1 Tax=Alteromonas sp. AMM-1 TaxID=3394233 RepID=UPI0039A60C05